MSDCPCCHAVPRAGAWRVVYLPQPINMDVLEMRKPEPIRAWVCNLCGVIFAADEDEDE